MATSLLAAVPAAATGFDNGLAVTTDRVRRGVSQTDGPGAIVELKYDAAQGWFAGLWVASAHYANVRGATVELIPFAGYHLHTGSLHGEVGLLHHAVPGTSRPIDYDEAEITLSRRFGRLSLSPALYWRWRNDVGGHSRYASIDARYDITTTGTVHLSASLHGGRYHDPRDSRNSYDDGQASLSLVQGRTILSLAASDSDLDPRALFPGASNAGKRLSLTLTRMFRPAR